LTVTCGACRFWERKKDVEGECHCHCPEPGYAGKKRARWPLTLASEWCGDFQPLPVQQKMEAPDALARPAP
jgi:hypothetical protein